MQMGVPSYDGYTRDPAAREVMVGDLNMDILLSVSEWSEHGTFVKPNSRQHST